jgi:hypothetical protein
MPKSGKPLNAVRKGKVGERELAGLLSRALGLTVQRKLAASRDGGSDLEGVPGWSIEVKNTATFLEAYWKQALDQAAAEGLLPVLFWKEPRKGWRVFVDARSLRSGVFSQPHRVQMSIDAWCELIAWELAL